MNDLFLPEDDHVEFLERRKRPRFWKVLVVDDEPEVIGVTKLALREAEFFGRHLEIIEAKSAKECIDRLKENPDVCLILMDVVMESDHAGLDAIEYIRKIMKNALVRIILRTGQPGSAPEREVIRNYDINDYKEKTELTSNKLYTVVHTSIGQWRQLKALDEHREGLEQIIKSSVRMFEISSVHNFSGALLRQLVAVLFKDQDALMVSGIATTTEHPDPIVVAAMGEFQKDAGYPLSHIEDKGVADKIRRAMEHGTSVEYGQSFIGVFRSKRGIVNAVYVESEQAIPFRDKRLIELFIHNVSVVYENLMLHEDIIHSQTSVILLLTQAIEEHSLETKYHVRRVAEYSRLLGKLNGLGDDACNALKAAAMLHDTGKIAIPDAILQKPGKLTPGERMIMETHAARGAKILAGNEGEMLVKGAIVAGQHHERWDGRGYPKGLKGNEIDLFGRITALADVFDALTSKRVYKEAWPIEDALDYIKKERGGHFEPKQVDLFVDNLEQFLAIKAQFVDEE